MGLPEIIEIQPLASVPAAEVTVPGSKSLTNRALILAALARGTTILKGSLWSEDTQVMVDCLRKLGFHVSVEKEPGEAGNRTISVTGQGGSVPPGGTLQQPLDLFVGNAGTAARFLTAFLCLGKGVYRLSGIPRMHERPQAELFEALRALGYRLDSVTDKLPVLIHGAGPRPGQVVAGIGESSQFASALLLSAHVGQWRVQVKGEHPDESPYVAMTYRLIDSFPKAGGEFQLEPDASSGSYFWAAGFAPGHELKVRVANWPHSGWQIDEHFPRYLQRWAAENSAGAPRISRKHDLGDSIMTTIALAPLLDAPVMFTDLGRLRVQECERVEALRVELGRCGAKVVESGDTLRVHPARLHGATIETYNDHRMAMSFAILGLKVGGIKIKNPMCVRKTFPNFFQKLAAPSPIGLGATIRDAGSGRVLAQQDLSAD